MTNFLRRCLYTLFFVVVSALQLMAQKEADPVTAKNVVYLELVGNSVYYSLNYERIFFQQNNLKAGARVGFGVIPVTLESKRYWEAVLPVELTGLWGRKHHLELGVGYTPFLIAYSVFNPVEWESEFDSYKLLSLIPFRIGYRYQKPDGGFFLRAGYTPILDLSKGRNNSFRVIHGGISLGMSF